MKMINSRRSWYCWSPSQVKMHLGSQYFLAGNDTPLLPDWVWRVYIKQCFHYVLLDLLETFLLQEKKLQGGLDFHTLRRYGWGLDLEQTARGSCMLAFYDKKKEKKTISGNSEKMMLRSWGVPRTEKCSAPCQTIWKLSNVWAQIRRIWNEKFKCRHQ